MYFFLIYENIFCVCLKKLKFSLSFLIGVALLCLKLIILGGCLGEFYAASSVYFPT